jgi:hypothetical protein
MGSATLDTQFNSRQSEADARVIEAMGSNIT